MAASTSSAVVASARSSAYRPTSRWTRSTCSRVWVTARSPGRLLGAYTDQNWPPTPPSRSRGRSVAVVGTRPAMSRRSRSPPTWSRSSQGRSLCPSSTNGMTRGRVCTPVDSQRDGHSEVGAGRRSACRPGDAGMHAQRRRLRGARRPAHRGGLGPRRGRSRRRRRGRQHVRVRRAGQEGLHRRAARGGRPQGPRVRGAHPGRRRGRVHGGAVRREARLAAAGGRRRAGVRLLRVDVRPPHDDPRRWPRRVAYPRRPPEAAAAVAGRAAGCRRRRLDPGARGIAAGEPDSRIRAAGRAGPPRRPAVGAAEDRQRLRPAVLVLRDPDVPRRVPVAASRRRAGRGAVAGRRGRARGVPRQRELHVLRQGPRRPDPAGVAAAGARRGRRASSGFGCRTCSRPRSGPAC